MSDVLSSLSADSRSPATEVETERVVATPEPLVASLLALQGALQEEIHGQLVEWRREFSSHAEEQRRLPSEHCRQVLEELAKHSRARRGGDSSSCRFSSAGGSSLEDEALCDTAPHKPALFGMSPLKLAERFSGDMPPGAAEAPEALARRIASEYVADMLRRVQQEAGSPAVARTPLVRRRRSSAIDSDGLPGLAA